MIRTSTQRMDKYLGVYSDLSVFVADEVHPLVYIIKPLTIERALRPKWDLLTMSLGMQILRRSNRTPCIVRFEQSGSQSRLL